MRNSTIWTWTPSVILTTLVIIAAWMWLRVSGPVPHGNANRGVGPAAQTETTSSPAVRPRIGLTVSTGTFAGWRAEGVKIEDAAADTAERGTTADKVVEDSSHGPHVLSATVDLDLTRPVSASVSARHGERRRLLLFVTSGAHDIQCQVELETGQATGGMSGSAKLGTCATEVEQAGWWRVRLTGRFDAARHGETFVGIAPALDPFGSEYQGDGKGHIFIRDVKVSQ
jgi:hypothetical protein